MEHPKSLPNLHLPDFHNTQTGQSRQPPGQPQAARPRPGPAAPGLLPDLWDHHHQQQHRHVAEASQKRSRRGTWCITEDDVPLFRDLWYFSYRLLTELARLEALVSSPLYSSSSNAPAAAKDAYAQALAVEDDLVHWLRALAA